MPLRFSKSKRCIKVVRGFFDPELVLDYMRYLVLFEDDGDSLIKKIAGSISSTESASLCAKVIAVGDIEEGKVRERLGNYEIDSDKQGQPAASALPLTFSDSIPSNFNERYQALCRSQL